MSVAKGLRDFLLADAGVSAQIGTRLYANQHVPQGAAYPHATYYRVSTNRRRHLKGSSNLPTARYQVDAFGQTYADAFAAAEAIRSAIGENGQSGTWDGTTIVLARLDDESDTYTAPFQDDDNGAHQISLDLFITYRNT